MKRFIKYLIQTLILFLIFIGLIFSVKYLIFSYSSKYYLKNYSIKEIQNVDIGIFGHSQSETGLNENILNSKSNLVFENFSISGVPLYYTCTLIQNTIKNNNEMDIVLEIGSNNLGEKGSMKTFISKKGSKQFFDFFYYTLNDNESKFIKYKFIDYLIFGSLHSPLINFKGTRLDESKINIAYDRFNEKLRDVNKKWRNPYGEDFELNRLEQLIKQNPLTNFLIIRIPEHFKNKEIYSNDYRFHYLEKKISKYKNVKIKDYIDFQLNEDSYRDFNHLSSKGQEIFTNHFYLDNY